MRKSPMTIALVIAGVVAGTTAGIAAINTESTSAAQTVALQPAGETQLQTQTPVETIAPAESVAAQDQSGQVAQAQETRTVRAPTVRATAPVPPPAANSDEEKMVRIPFTNYYVKVTNPTFPTSSPEISEPSPSVIAYFDRLEATRLAATQQTPSAPTAALELPSTTTAVQPTVQAALAGN